MPDNQRPGRKVLRVSGQLFLNLFMEGNEWHCRITQGLPEGARFIAMNYTPLQDWYELVFESDTWQPVAEGMPLEILLVTMQRLCDA